MRVLGRIFGVLFGVLLALLIAGYFFIQDANRLKPELQALIEDNSDYQVELNGDVSWQLFPPLQLELQDIVLTKEDQRIQAANMDLKMDLSAMWQDIDQWRVTALNLVDTHYAAEGANTHIKQLEVLDFRPEESAPFTVDLSHTAKGAEVATNAQLAGQLTYYPGQANRGQRISFAATKLNTDIAQGVCDADITAVLEPPMITMPDDAEQLLPLDTLNEYDLSAQCTLSELTLQNETFTNAKLAITNVAGQLNLLLDLPDFLGGTLLAEADVDTTTTPIEWRVLPEIENVDSQRLLDWTDQRLQWIAAIAFNSSISLQGNTVAELANSVQATSEFDGGQGQLNIAKIKAQLMRVALLTQRTEEVIAWPDVWDYQEFVGRWQIKGPAHDIKFALDNMSVDAQGTYDYAKDALDLLANVTINEGDNSPFRINPMLEGTPIPLRCTGPAEDPKCRLDENATKKLVANALQRDSDTGLRRKLEDKIDEEVPEEYRETARELLDILGRALDRD